MSDETETTLDLKKFNAIIAALENNKHYIKVGIIGQGKERNAQIGACHEFGTSRIPQRSFLRNPINDNLQKYLDVSGLIEEEDLKKISNDKSLMSWLSKVSIISEKIVLDAFATGGFGKWKSHAEGYENNTGMILVDTQQLRDSITSEVV